MGTESTRKDRHPAWTAGPRHDGTAQPDRLRPELAEDFFRVDEVSPAGLIAMSARLADNIRFDPSAKSETWKDLYVGEPLFALAELASFDVRKWFYRLHELFDTGDAVRLDRYVRRLQSHLESWRSTLAASDGQRAQVLWRRLEKMVGDLAIRGSDAGGSPGSAPRPIVAEEWSPFLGGRLGEEAPQSEGSLGQLRELHATGHRVLTAISYLKSDSVDALNEAMKTGRHNPALGLSLAFLELFSTAQGRLNEFTRRRLEFYYFDVLRFEARGKKADRAHLVLSTAPGTKEVLVPRGTEFSGGRDERNEDLVYVADTDLVVVDARVERLHTLLFERNQLISPERELGFVTGIRSDHVEREALDATEDGPLFTSRPTSGTVGHRAEGELGFAVASRVLHLREGRRRVRFEIELGRRFDATDTGGAPGGPPQRDWDLVDRDNAMEELHRCETADKLFDTLGRIFTMEIMSAQPWLSREGESGDAAGAIRAAAERVLEEGDSDTRQVIEDLLASDRRALFHDLFRRSLAVSVTVEGGWYEAEHAYIGPAAEGLGLIVELELGPEVGPVVACDPEVHGVGHETDHPVARFRVSARAIFHPYSLLRELELKRVAIEATVEGITDLVAYNRFGALDAGKPFQPFGPLADRDSDFVVGSYEAATKSLIGAWLEIEWDGLPRGAGGWRHHYSEYDEIVSNDSFKAELTVSRGRGWAPADPARRGVSPLFASKPDGRLVREQVIPLDRVLDFQRPLGPEVTEDEFKAAPRDQNGLFRLSLAASEVGFGHQEYPAVLRRVVSANARRKRKPLLAEPNAPYTPAIKRITLNYVARSSITLGADEEWLPERVREKVFHDYPFGARDITAEAGDLHFSLMPGGPASVDGSGGLADQDGYLFIGLSGTRISGRLSLMIHVVRSETASPEAITTDVVWYYLASNRWHALEEHRVVEDTTKGFQRSGIVTLDIPDEINRDNPFLPGDNFWLVVGGTNLDSAIARLHSLRANGLSVTWQDRGNLRPVELTQLPAGTIEEPLTTVAGLGTVTQVGGSFGGRPAEDYNRVVTRAAERLRHKNRSATPWDYERLILERFPYLYKVKCLPCVDVDRFPESVPGSVLVVVVPRLEEPSTDAWTMRLVSGYELSRIADELRSIASSTARITVRNPTYETVQVRCRVKLKGHAQAGLYLQRVNQAIIDFIAPWQPGGRGGRFGWTIRKNDVAALLHALPFVEFVTDLSLLHVSQDEVPSARFRRGDTAQVFEATASGCASSPRKDGRGESDRIDAMGDGVSARYPWSLAVPSARHFIQATSERTPIPPKITGIGELEVGQNFILEPLGD